MKQEAQQALETLSNLSVQSLLSNGLEEWAVLGNRLGFPTPLPQKPPLPPLPQKPEFGSPPREDDAAYAVVLSTLDRLLSARRIKKQDAALKRFEKDRKAWNEDRDYALGLYEKAKKQHREATAALEVGYEAALTQWKSDFEAFLRTLIHDAA